MTNLVASPFKSESLADEPVITVLDNGLRVATANRKGLFTLVAVTTNVGSRFENPQNNGLSHFLEHMAFKGTTNRSAKDIVLEAERLGSSVNAMTGHNTTAYVIDGLTSHVDTSLDILADVIQNSTFPVEEVEREKGAVIQEIMMYDDDIDDIAHRLFMATAFKDQPMGAPIIGYTENVQGFTQTDLSNYLTHHYQPKNMVVTAVGDVDHDTFVEMVKARFGSMINGDLPNKAQQAVYVGGTATLRDERFEQAQVIVGFPSPGSLSEDRHAYHMLAEVLGGGMSAPLFQTVREERGLCYYIGSGVSSQPEQSLFIIQSGTSPENVEQVITLALQELVRIATGEITDADWERATNQTLRQIASSAEKKPVVTARIASQLFYQGRVRSTEDAIKAVFAVTRDDVIAAANALIESSPTVTVAGNGPDLDYAVLVRGAIAQALAEAE